MPHTCASAPTGTREFATELSGDLAQAFLGSSPRFIDLTNYAWTNNKMWVMARNISGATFDLASTKLSVEVNK